MSLKQNVEKNMWTSDGGRRAAKAPQCGPASVNRGFYVVLCSEVTEDEVGRSCSQKGGGVFGGNRLQREAIWKKTRGKTKKIMARWPEGIRQGVGVPRRVGGGGLQKRGLEKTGGGGKGSTWPDARGVSEFG